MIEFKDYYKILGVERTASLKEIKSAFKKLAKQFHPDSKTGSEEKFKEVNEAYEVLKDQEKRAKYDSMYKYQSTFDGGAYANPFDEFSQSHTRQRRKRPRGFAGSTEGTFSDFFETLFGQYANQTKNANDDILKPQKGADYEMPLELNLEDAFHGTNRKIEITGTSSKTRRLEVSIPAGVKDGTKIKISNEGKPGKNNGPKGDLYLIIKLIKHPLFWVEGSDIHQELEISPAEAVLGTVKKIATLAEHLEVNIPAKAKNNLKLRLKSKGLVKNASKKEYGDHYVHIRISIPEKISEKEKKLYEELKKLEDDQKA